MPIEDGLPIEETWWPYDVVAMIVVVWHSGVGVGVVAAAVGSVGVCNNRESFVWLASGYLSLSRASHWLADIWRGNG